MDVRLPDWVLELVPDALDWRPVQSIYVDQKTNMPRRIAVTLTNGHSVDYTGAQVAEFYNVAPMAERLGRDGA